MNYAGFDQEGLQLSQFGSSSPLRWLNDAMDHGLQAEPTKLTRQFSACELLPLEIRQEIYVHLGYPVGTKVWADCEAPQMPSIWDDDKKVDERFNEKVDERVDEKVDEKVEAAESNPMYEKRVQAEPRSFIAYRLPIKQTVWSCELVLLLVNKKIRNEALYLLFAHIPAQFKFPLSTRKIHYDNWRHCYTHPWPRPKGVFERMKFVPSTFAALTTIHLDSSIGKGYTYERPYNTTSGRSKTNLRLRRQIETLRFIAGLLGEDWAAKKERKPRQKYITSIVLAFLEVVRKCPRFETLEIPRKPTCRCHCVLNDEEGLAKHFVPDESRHIAELDLKTVPEYLREDTVRDWTRRVLRNGAKEGDVDHDQGAPGHEQAQHSHLSAP